MMAIFSGKEPRYFDSIEQLLLEHPVLKDYNNLIGIKEIVEGEKHD